jgi:hypothetical protein
MAAIPRLGHVQPLTATAPPLRPPAQDNQIRI